MKKEQIYTETNTAGVYNLLKVDTFKKEYQLYENIKENKINMELADFIALDLFEALILGLQAKNYKQI